MLHPLAREPRGMKTKIKWFKEVLELEPGSKVFFPLARMYYEDGLIDEAEETLLQGLERNPDHLEARFLLVEILDRQGEPIRAADEVGAITKVLSRYPAFWKSWSETAAPQSRDAAMALSFLAANFQGRPISWSQVIAKGLDALVGDGPVHEAMPEAAREPEAEAEAEDGPTTRTRTMADLLAEQGDYQGALDIYEELLAKGETSGEGDLPTRIALMRAELGMDDAEDDLVPPSPSEAAVAQSLGGGSLDETVADFLGELMPAGARPQEEADPDEAPDFDELAELEVAPDFDAVVEEEPTPIEPMAATDPEAESMADDLDISELDALDDAVEGLEELAVAEAQPDSDSSDSDEVVDPEPVVAVEAAEPEPAEAAESESPESASMPGKEALMQTLEALADRLEARSAL